MPGSFSPPKFIKFIARAFVPTKPIGHKYAPNEPILGNLCDFDLETKSLTNPVFGKLLRDKFGNIVDEMFIHGNISDEDLYANNGDLIRKMFPYNLISVDGNPHL